MAISVTDLGSATALSGATVAISTTNFPVPANVLIVTGIVETASSGVVGTVADSAANSYANLSTKQEGGTSTATAAVFFFNQNASTLTSITYTAANSAHGSAIAGLYATGIATSTPNDATATASASGSGASPQTASVTSGVPGSSGDLFVGWSTESRTAGSSAITFTQATGWASPLTTATWGAGRAFGGGNQVNSGSAALTFNPQYSGSGNTMAWASIVVAFKPSTIVAIVGQSSFELPPSQVPPRQVDLRSWAWNNTRMLGKDTLPFGRTSYDLPPRGAEPNPRRSWEFTFNRNLIGKDQLPVGKQIYDLPPRPVEPSPRRSWEWSYKLNLIGADQLPVGARIYDLAPGQVVPRQPDLRTWAWNYNLNLIGKDRLPFNQYDWPNPKANYRIDQTWAWRQVDKIGLDTLPFNQYDWPLPTPPARDPTLRTWFWAWSNYILPPPPFPKNQYDWPLPKVAFQFDRSSYYTSPFAPQYPVIGPAQYFLLQPHYIGSRFFPAWTTITEGIEIPVGWVPTLAVDPLNVAAVNAFYAAGPRPSASLEWGYQNWQQTSPDKPFVVLPGVTHWKANANGSYSLTGLGAALAPRYA